MVHQGDEELCCHAPSRSATIDRTETSRGSEAPDVAAIGSAACPDLASGRPMPMDTRRPFRLTFGVTAALDCFRLDGHTISATGRGARDPVDRLPSDDALAGHGISPLAQPGNRCPRRVRKPSRRLGQIDDGRAVGSPQQVDHQRQLAAVSRSGRRGASADVIQTDVILRLREKLSLGRLAGLDRVLRSLVDGDRFQPCTCGRYRPRRARARHRILVRRK